MQVFDDEDEKIQFWMALLLVCVVLEAVGILLATIGPALIATARAQGQDLIFTDSFEDEAAGPPPPRECPPPPEGYFQSGPFTLSSLWPGGNIGAELVQIRMPGDSYKALSFERHHLPSAFDFNADTSNVGGGGAVGADMRLVVVSDCAGDFGPQTQPACTSGASEGPFMLVSWDTAIPFACNLDSNKTNYFNVTFGTAPCNNSVIPPKNNCAFRISVQPRD